MKAQNYEQATFFADKIYHLTPNSTYTHSSNQTSPPAPAASNAAHTPNDTEQKLTSPAHIVFQQAVYDLAYCYMSNKEN